ncbi:serine/threonine protein kinase [Clostridium ganghwense]|uniref:Serine/threonine protein kinase n=1 Tax=Clostridium ganghwense TaxID=312089 RepID=A0ABT4CLD0_9CLOT|nr:serine/threonine protein kinase [Clostridium ganghwense]MCY6369056.1 serine/threonine protein kinase [Clostridium ganghwense]
MINIGKKYLGIDIKKCKFLGEGCEGRVYLTPDGHALKIFKNKANCKAECNILKKVEGSKYFPKIIKANSRYILREYVDGNTLENYIIKNGLSKKLAINLIKLVEEFKKLNFKRLDMRGVHIFVQEDESVMVIDPRKTFTKKISGPVSMLKSLEKVGALDKFIKVLISERPDLAVKWIKAFAR